jgi:SpoVK/Ycf46/Vps4 family AAA+-type ATPase
MADERDRLEIQFVKKRHLKTAPQQTATLTVSGKPLALNELSTHFRNIPLTQLVTASREFAITARVDIQNALNYLLCETYPARLLGIHRMYSHSTLTFSDLLNTENDPVFIAPLQYWEMDVGELVPVRCLRQGLWLCRDDEVGLSFAVLLTPLERSGRDWGSHVEIAVPAGEEGAKLTRTLLDYVEKLVNEGQSYRGKVISLQAVEGATSGAVRVQRLRSVKREDVILPQETLQLLEQNVVNFIHHREELKKLGMASKKGLLFYGPAGTGKTHTIHYLASQLPGHTTLLVTPEQIGMLDQYFQLARLLQPTMLVIDDVDLIVRGHDGRHGPCDESLINKLLNEMDSVQDDTATLFVLTTNRPEQLEAALASRPGLIDQAIDFPFPDEDGRRRLVRLYARNLEVTNEIVTLIVQKTNRASGAFIKELMRRAAQYFLQSDSEKLEIKHVESALDEMLFRGGSLNLKLLGVAQAA